MLIRLATADDAPRWQALRLEALQAHPDAFGSSYAEECAMSLATVQGRLTDPLNRVWLAEMDGELLGTATARREGIAKAAHRTNLFAMYVAPTARGRGLARQLLDAVIGSARDTLAADYLQLAVSCHNAAACALYQRAGFEIEGRRRDALRVGERQFDEYHMVLDLRASKEATP